MISSLSFVFYFDDFLSEAKVILFFNMQTKNDIFFIFILKISLFVAYLLILGVKCQERSSTGSLDY